MALIGVFSAKASLSSASPTAIALGYDTPLSRANDSAVEGWSYVLIPRNETSCPSNDWYAASSRGASMMHGPQVAYQKFTTSTCPAKSALETGEPLSRVPSKSTASPR